MSFPIFDIEGETSLNIQLIPRKKKNMKFPAGFTNVDEAFLQILAAVIQAKLHQIMAQLARKRTEREVIKTIGAASVICTQRSYSDFILKCSKILPDFFGFEGVGILFRDHTNSTLFSIELDEKESEAELLKIKEQKIKNNEKLTEDEIFRDIQRQYRRRSTHVFPNSLGLTGQVFHSGQILHSNKMNKLQGYLPNIDNLAEHIKDVHNIMIVPIFGHRKTPGIQEDKQQPIAIIQFINKCDLRQIDEYDLAKIDAMRDLLGMSIDNASQHHAVLNMKVGVRENFHAMNDLAAQGESLAEESKRTFD